MFRDGVRTPGSRVAAPAGDATPRRKITASTGSRRCTCPRVLPLTAARLVRSRRAESPESDPATEHPPAFRHQSGETLHPDRTSETAVRSNWIRSTRRPSRSVVAGVAPARDLLANRAPALPPAVGTDSMSSRLRTISQEVKELEFHMSPVCVSSRPQTSAGTVGTRSRTRCAIDGHPSGAVGSRLPRRCPGSRRRASNGLRSGRSGTAPPTGCRRLLRRRRRAPRRRCPRRAPSRSRTAPPVRVPRAQSGRGHTSAALTSGCDRLVDMPVEPHEVTARAEREPVQIDAGFGLRERGALRRTAVGLRVTLRCLRRGLLENLPGVGHDLARRRNLRCGLVFGFLHGDSVPHAGRFGNRSSGSDADERT